MTTKYTTPPGKLLYESLFRQSYGHTRFSKDIDTPNIDNFIQKSNIATQENSHFTIPKVHPISKSVYFSGISEEIKLPHDSQDAIKNYNEYQLKLQNQLEHSFNPKPKPR